MDNSTILDRMTDEQKQQVRDFVSDPKRWCEAMLPHPEDPNRPFRANWLQGPYILSKDAPERIAITAHRQAGKTAGVAARILWFACTQSSRMVIIVTPTSSALDRIFRFLRHYLLNSEHLRASIVQNVRNPQRIQLANGSIIYGFITGVASSQKGIHIRGQSCHFAYIDEADYIQEEDWEAVSPIWSVRPGDRAEPPIAWLSCTVKGAITRFYKICHDIEGFGKGWTWWNFPAKATGEETLANPEWTEADDERARYNTTENGYKQEYLCQLGTMQKAIIRKEFIDLAKAKGKEAGLKYTATPGYHATRVLGVDWDKYEATPNICCVEIDPADAVTCQVIYREEVPEGQFTLNYAVDRIRELDKTLHPKFIYVDRGYGEAQIETLQMHGLNHVIGIAYNSKTDYQDPVTGEKIKVPIKHAMVNMMQWYFEKGLLKLCEEDTKLTDQIQMYRVERITTTGLPVYTSKDDHAVCALMTALFGIVENFNNPYIHKREYGLPKLAQVDWYKNWKLENFSDARETRPPEPDELMRARVISLQTTRIATIHPRSNLSGPIRRTLL